MSYCLKYLSFGLKNKTGINFTGRRTFKSKGSGKNKRKYRLIDFYFNNYLIPFFVLNIQYDPNRSSKIALICYKNGVLSYILAVQGLKENSFLSRTFNNVGLIKLLKEYKYGTFVSCIEFRANKGGKVARSAGCFGIILHKVLNKKKIIIRLPSGEERLFCEKNKAILGIISNIKHKFLKLKKAGNNIWKGKKPIVRGVAKNSVDHPHGGGRGKSSKLKLPSNFTRKVLKGVPSIKKKFLNKNLIIKKRKWKKFLK